tara:strand:- start:421 stop:558 length:138 start_codon:yes stop_codon:yes gene_type:complete
MRADESNALLALNLQYRFPDAEYPNAATSGGKAALTPFRKRVQKF